MIDERHLLTLLKLWKKQVDERGTHYTQSQWIGRVIEEINIMPKVGEWTLCSEMLPPIDMSYPNAKDYLVYYEHGYYDVASYSNINRFWHEHTTEPYWNCEQYCKVVAWMPLPEPYKG